MSVPPLPCGGGRALCTCSEALGRRVASSSLRPALARGCCGASGEPPCCRCRSRWARPGRRRAGSSVPSPSCGGRTWLCWAASSASCCSPPSCWPCASIGRFAAGSRECDRRGPEPPPPALAALAPALSRPEPPPPPRCPRWAGRDRDPRPFARQKRRKDWPGSRSWPCAARCLRSDAEWIGSSQVLRTPSRPEPPVRHWGSLPSAAQWPRAPPSGDPSLRGAPGGLTSAVPTWLLAFLV
ncbi:uncharacterized protein C10orf95-like [Notechis scutatus]|uniref:Uncharacterized protein C10orf95-like n=1 Tax=Notechis scutatus TaxID=8663 RepID=A0A6J1VEM9_9SAUR|nr:uncharacterized protein C10orf95-like [Notechis scutatus]